MRALGGVQVFAAGLGEFPNAEEIPGGCQAFPPGDSRTHLSLAGIPICSAGSAQKTNPWGMLRLRRCAFSFLAGIPICKTGMGIAGNEGPRQKENTSRGSLSARRQSPRRKNKKTPDADIPGRVFCGNSPALWCGSGPLSASRKSRPTTSGAPTPPLGGGGVCGRLVDPG